MLFREQTTEAIEQGGLTAAEGPIMRQDDPPGALVIFQLIPTEGRLPFHKAPRFCLNSANSLSGSDTLGATAKKVAIAAPVPRPQSEQAAQA